MAISSKYIIDFVAFVIDKTHHKKQRKDDIMLAAYEASLIKFKEYKQAFEVTSTISEYMSVFEYVDTYPAITVPNGAFPKPTGYNRYVMITTDTGRSVDVVKAAAWPDRVNHAIKAPTASYPIARIGNDNIIVLPATVKIHLTYWKNPQQPTYVESSGVFDPNNSVPLEWSMELWPEIANLILGKMGINLGEQQIIEYSKMQER